LELITGRGKPVIDVLLRGAVVDESMLRTPKRANTYFGVVNFVTGTEYTVL
jgi:hypothetical protein